MPYFWIPGDNAHDRERRDRVPYLTWAKHGHITMTEGNVIDYEVIRRDINKLATDYHIKLIAADQHNATHLCSQLQQDGLTLQWFRQGFMSMNSPTKELERLILNQGIAHGGHPVLRWCASNVAIETDAAGNIKCSKSRSSERIDGVIALVQALGVAMVQQDDSTCVYESRGILTI